ncbi:MAG: tetratricopeptide repeat protein [Planctomycetes bacterium]|nr:tetratricopeptide repeat protein [Planctomycetota bacterium]
MQNNAVTPLQQPVGWTQRVTNAFKKGGSVNGSQKLASNSQLDPISLGFASGPPNAELYLSMAKMSDQGGNTPHARSMYQRALTIDPENLDGMLALARLEDREGQLDAALHYYKQAVQTHPQSAKALNDLSLCFARRNQLAEALPPLEQAIRLQPSKPLYRNNIAKVLLELNQVNVALQHQSAVHPPAVAQYNIGVLLHQRGRDAEAVQFLTGASQADPTLVAASTLLAQLTSGTQNYIQSAATNDSVLPTPQTSPYPTTGAVSVPPTVQMVPAETARVPVGYSPAALPPVR